MAFALRLFFLLLVLCLSSSGIVTADLVDRVCAQSTYPSVCQDYLRSDGRSATANLPLLGNIAIELTLANSRAALLKINRLKEQTKDVELKKRLDSCYTTYTMVVVKHCLDASRFLDARDYRGMDAAGDSLTLDAFQCDRAFRSPPSYSCPIQYEDTRTSVLGDIISTIAHVLEKN